MQEPPHTVSRDSTRPTLSVVIPAYNEGHRIARTLTCVHTTLAESGLTYEILLANDGSTDNTLEQAHEVINQIPELVLLDLRHQGKATAVRAGMRFARGEFVLFFDADLATPLRYAAEFVELAKHGSDVVIASREGILAERIGEPEYRHFMGRVFNRMVQMLVLPGIEDTQCGFKLFSAQATESILVRSLLYPETDAHVSGARVTAFDVELLVIARRLGFRITEIPVEWIYGEQSKVHPFRDSLLNFRDIVLIKWNDLRGRYAQ